MTELTTQIAKSYIDAVNCVLSGNLTLDQLRGCWRIEVDRDKLLWRLFSEAEHYIVDKDIRANDSFYERYQRDLLASLIADVKKKYLLPD